MRRLKLDSDAAVVNYIMFYNQEENARTRYDESYSKFRDWVHTSLDLYKPELLAMLFPVFVHCYIDLVSKGYFEEGAVLCLPLHTDVCYSTQVYGGASERLRHAA